MAQTSRAGTWVNDILMGLTAASGVGYLATAYSISRWLTRATPTVVEPIADLACEALTCRTVDGLALAGWAVAPPEPRGTIALFHGMRWDRLQTLSRIRFLVRAGWRCVAFDHRAHGESDGKVTSFGWHESRDVAAVAELIGKRWPHEPTAALGISMGAAALCYAQENTAPFHAFILEGLYHDLAGAFHQRVGCGYPAWFGLFTRGVIWFMEKRLGLRVRDAAPAEYVGRLHPRPVLLLTGTDDVHATPDEVARIFDRCADPREFHVIPGAGHNNIDSAGGERYQELVLGFLDRHLPNVQDSEARLAA